MIPTVVALTGLALALAASAAWFRALTRVAIPRNRLPFLVSWAAAVGLGALALALPGAGWLGSVPAVLAVLGGGTMLALYALGDQRAAGAIAVGDTMPRFTAPDDRGATFDSAVLSGSLVLIKFFRGHW